MREPRRGAEVGRNASHGRGWLDRDPSGRRRDAAGLTGLMPAAGTAGEHGGSSACREGSQLEIALREHWWAAVACIVRRTGDLEVAEDAVQEACAAAVAQWPGDGIPPNPRAWLITTAWHKAVDAMRRDALRADREVAALGLAMRAEPAVVADPGPAGAAVLA